ncbi:FAD-dependent oxidoreductase [Streptomyces europaeiscabiei]|uniref:FAD-dependent oxidoreductase n=1 Tax=Streptomyces europaeiscabiei TaxID=146819 RepID=UPI0029B4C226|nr:FAD-dependent oxidoreductase [Streptomyces europaeiscabiei]MDX3697591.1 FAD-dependent oxidoreductase [Streptomyces europaeiscabiei]
MQTHDGRCVPLVRHAGLLCQQLQAENGRELRRLTGALVMGPADDPEMRTVMDVIAEHGLDHGVIDTEAMTKCFPYFRVDDGDLVVLDSHAGFGRPELTVQTAALRAEELGARIRRYTPVREVTPVAGGGAQIRTDTDTERFDAAVVTPGPWVGDLLPDLLWEVSVYRTISAWFLPHQDHPLDAERPAFTAAATSPPTASRLRTAWSSSSACPRPTTSPWTTLTS